MAPVKLTTVPKLDLLVWVLLFELIVSVKKAVEGISNGKCAKGLLLVRSANLVVVDQAG